MDGSPQTVMLLIGTVLTSGWLGSVLVQWLKGRSDRSTALATAELGREGQLDDLTKELINSAKSDIRELREELAILRPLQAHLLHFEEAIFHLEAIVTSEGSALLDAKRAANAFLKRIDRTRRAVGNIRQEAQILQSEAAITAAAAARREQGK